MSVLVCPTVSSAGLALGAAAEGWGCGGRWGLRPLSRVFLWGGWEGPIMPPKAMPLPRLPECSGKSAETSLEESTLPPSVLWLPPILPKPVPHTNSSFSSSEGPSSGTFSEGVTTVCPSP